MPPNTHLSKILLQPPLRHGSDGQHETDSNRLPALSSMPPGIVAHPASDDEGCRSKTEVNHPQSNSSQPSSKGKTDLTRGFSAFRVQPQQPSNNEHISQHQTVFQSHPVSAPSLRFKESSAPNLRFKDSKAMYFEAKSPKVSRPSNKKVKFACNKTTTGFTERREKPLEHPPKKQKLARYPRENKHFLTSRKPISTFIPIDAWALIFRRCHPKFLLQARLVCKDFREVLKQQSIWREARQYTWDDAVPECPQNVTEIQYAKLLAGRGCQISPCVNNLTKKVYWAFMLRMCEKCFSGIVVLPEAGSEEEREYTQLRDTLEPEIQQTIPAHLSGLIPAGAMWAGKWSQVRSLDPEEHMWRFQNEPASYCVLADDYDALKQDFREKVLSEPSYFLFWARLRWGRTKERILLAKELDLIDQDLLEKSSNRFQREDKVEFFTEKAKELDPPMTSSILKKMAAYHKAIDTANAPSERAWDLLASKIDEAHLRTQAEQLIEWEQDDMDCCSTPVEDGLHDRIARHRGRGILLLNLHQRPPSPRHCPEQKFVLEIANRELHDLIDVVHDEDVLLMLLDRTRRCYESEPIKPHGLNGDGIEGEYRLLLDDARVVANEVLQPVATQKGRTRAQIITSSLRCIACTRHDCHRKYNFEQLISHVRNSHANRVGKGLHFWKLAVPFQSKMRRYSDSVAWYHLPWPKSLPALPCHRRAKIGMIWDPDIETEYVQHPAEDNFSLFANMTARSPSTLQSKVMTDNFCHAVHTLEDTRLDSLPIIKLGLEYATQLTATSHTNEGATLRISISQLEELEFATQNVASRIDFKFKCGICTRDATITAATRRRRPREILHPQSISVLGVHWTGSKHTFEIDQAVEHLIELPSDFAVHQAMTQEDKRLATQKERAIAANKRRFGDHVDKEGKVPVKDPRAEALLQVPSIWSRFNMLFKPKDEIAGEDDNLLFDDMPVITKHDA